MKRRYVLILMLAMSFCLTACGKKENTAVVPEENNTEVVSQTEVDLQTEEVSEAEQSKMEDEGNELPIVMFDEAADKPNGDPATNVSTQESSDTQAESTNTTPQESQADNANSDSGKKPGDKSDSGSEDDSEETPDSKPQEPEVTPPEPSKEEGTDKPVEEDIELPFVPVN